MKTRVDRLRHEAGFTIIEVMVASLLLVLGVLAVTTMVNNANAVTDTTRAREGATNLARQLLEISRTQQYSRLDNSNLSSLLQAAGVPDDSAASGWQVRRRKVMYTVNSFSCIFDAARDGARTQSANAAATYCPGSATPVADDASSGKDNAPDDYRRVEFTVTWTRQGTTPDCNGQTTGSQLSNISTGIGRACVTQSELIPNPTGGLGPDIQTITYDPACCTVGTGTDLGAIEQNDSGQMAFTVTTTSPADQVLWRADDTVSSGSATQDTNDPTFKTWKFTYTYPTNPPLLDGPHTLTVQAFLASVSGVPKPYVINLNRNIPPSPNTQFTNVNNGAMSAIGVNTRLTAHHPPQPGDRPIVEVNWNQVGDGDILGYTAYKTTLLTPAPNVDTVACPSGASTLTGSTETSCADTNPNVITGLPSQIVNYYIVAFDNRWTVRQNPSAYVPGVPLPNQAQCPLLSGTLAIDLNGTAFPSPIRPGCPSAVIPVDINAASQLPQPTLNGTVTKDTTNGVSLDWPNATPANASAPIQFYRIYRNPASLSTPQVSERYSRSGTSSFIDPAPSATCDTYAVTAVDSNWQESDPISLGCP